MPQIICPDCRFKANDTAKSCPRCGKLFAPPPPSTAPTPSRATDEYVPSDSVGACPACKSQNTYDAVKDADEHLGFAGKVGVVLGDKLTGHGRYRCRRCGHTWGAG